MTADVFKRVVLRHKDRVHTYATWVLRDADAARDVTQQSLIRLWEQRGAVPEGAAGTWLRRTAHRLCVDRIRKQASRREVPLDALNVGPTNGERTVETAELMQSVGEALSELGSRDRAVIVLREMDGLSYEQMSDVLGLPLGTLKAALHRARERLRRVLTTAGLGP